MLKKKDNSFPGDKSEIQSLVVENMQAWANFSLIDIHIMSMVH